MPKELDLAEIRDLIAEMRNDARLKRALANKRQGSPYYHVWMAEACVSEQWAGRLESLIE